MTLLLITVFAVLAISAACSLSEAAIYAARIPYIRTLADTGSLAGRLLVQFKENIERPISTILIINTVANTAGAAIAGAQAQSVLPEWALIWFAAAFTLSVLTFSEIIPKILGVVYSERLARVLALPLQAAIIGLYPLVWLIEKLSQLIKPNEPILAAPEEEIEELAKMSAEEGSILEEEAEMVRNVLRLNDVTAAHIMTPRSVVVKFPAGITITEAAEKIDEWTYSRIPVYSDHDPETWIGFVLRRDILAKLAEDEFDITVGSLCQPLYFVSDSTHGHVMLKSFLKRKSHLFGVANHFGDLIGIVTLEDVIESLIGAEIVDEVDSAIDMQEVARLRKREQSQINDEQRRHHDN